MTAVDADLIARLADAEAYTVINTAKRLREKVEIAACDREAILAGLRAAQEMADAIRLCMATPEPRGEVGARYIRAEQGLFAAFPGEATRG